MVDKLDKHTLELIHKAYNSELDQDEESKEKADKEPEQAETAEEEKKEYKQPHGVIELTNAENVVTQRSEYYDGVLHGKTELFDGGKLAQCCLYVNGLLEGEATVYERGETISSITYIKGPNTPLSLIHI